MITLFALRHAGGEKLIRSIRGDVLMGMIKMVLLITGSISFILLNPVSTKVRLKRPF